MAQKTETIEPTETIERIERKVSDICIYRLEYERLELSDFERRYGQGITLRGNVFCSCCDGLDTSCIHYTPVWEVIERSR